MDRTLAAPLLCVSSLPPEERGHASHFNFLALQLTSHLSSFRNAIRLMAHCRALREAAKSSGYWIYNPDHDHEAWIFIAARAAAMEIYHFQIIINALRGTVGRCGSIRCLINKGALRQAQSLFRANFNHAERMRHAISHASEMVESQESYSFNFPTDTGSWIVSALDLEDGTFKLKHEGKKMTVVLNDRSLAKLEQVTRMLFAAIKPASDRTLYKR